MLANLIMIFVPFWLPNQIAFSTIIKLFGAKLIAIFVKSSIFFYPCMRNDFKYDVLFF